jgi:hypothetical protein
VKHCCAIVTLATLLCGCGAPSERITFPYRRLVATTQPQWFDIDGDRTNDFAVTFDANGKLDALCCDDDEDGAPDRVYHLADYPTDRVPHLILLLDSIPYQWVAERYAAGEFRWFDPPAKIIAPFPTLTEVSYSELLHAPPMPAAIDPFYDRRTGRLHSGLWSRAVGGYRYPWERYLHYRSSFTDEGFAYLDPRPHLKDEMERAHRAFDTSPDRVTLVYISSASGMACKYGRAGIDETLDAAARLCLQLLYERRGAVKITMMADHGHNLVPSRNIDVARLLKGGGFHVGKRLKDADDVVLELNGLVTYAAVRTTRPAAVAERLLTHPGVEFAMYMEGDRVIVRDASGAAAIEARERKIRYTPLTHDVFGYGKATENFASRDQWFAATCDREYPDAPVRVWEAFHERVVDPPGVMFTTRDGYCAGLPMFEKFIKMKSTHGSLNQINSATFLLTMISRVRSPCTMPTRKVMEAIEPSWRPGVVRR